MVAKPIISLDDIIQVVKEDNFLKFALSLTGNKDDAYDLVQETAMRLTMRIKKGPIRTDDASAYAYRSMRNIFYSIARREKTNDKLIRVISKNSPGYYVDSKDKYSLSEQIRDFVSEQCRRGFISLRQRDIFFLRFYAQKEPGVIAKTIGLSKSLVYSELRAVIKLLRCLAERAKSVSIDSESSANHVQTRNRKNI